MTRSGHHLTPVQRTHRPVERPGKGGHRAYRPCIRLEFDYTCLYCLSRESEVRPARRHGGFHLDHFRPESAGRAGANKYENIVWSCDVCNLAKSSRWPSTEEAEIGFGYPAVDDDWDSHIAPADDFRLAPISKRGRYLIEALDLNGEVHVRRRRERAKREEQLATLLAIADDVPAENAVDYQRALQFLKQDVWDPVTVCACAPVS